MKQIQVTKQHDFGERTINGRRQSLLYRQGIYVVSDTPVVGAGRPMSEAHAKQMIKWKKAKRVEDDGVSDPVDQAAEPEPEQDDPPQDGEGDELTEDSERSDTDTGGDGDAG